MSTEAETSQETAHHHDPNAVPLKPILKHNDHKYVYYWHSEILFFVLLQEIALNGDL